jgi:3'-phosphoadenosine 5'-phosphosulfate sulfotransferase (PAPS reductase)/FAD synthetase
MDFISLGAGVQSTTMLLMVCHGEIEFNGKYAIFSDTGWEPQHVYDHLEWLKKETSKFGIEVVVTDNGNIREDILEATGGGAKE